jgi:hypothetical protein
MSHRSESTFAGTNMDADLTFEFGKNISDADTNKRNIPKTLCHGEYDITPKKKHL